MAVDWMPYGLVESGELLTSEDSTKKKKDQEMENTKRWKMVRGTSRKIQKMRSDKSEIWLQRLDEWSILGMNHGHLW